MDGRDIISLFKSNGLFSFLCMNKPYSFVMYLFLFFITGCLVIFLSTYGILPRLFVISAISDLRMNPRRSYLWSPNIIFIELVRGFVFVAAPVAMFLFGTPLRMERATPSPASNL